VSGSEHISMEELFNVISLVRITTSITYRIWLFYGSTWHCFYGAFRSRTIQ
jgi:hypothetical protein